MLARFRADPKKIRVSIRRFGDQWLASVGSRIEDADNIRVVHTTSENAIFEALGRAFAIGLDGVDPHMERTYEHPWGEIFP